MSIPLRNLFIVVFFLFAVLLIETPTDARRGCCSWHGGVSGCDRDAGRLVCRDGTYSPSCGCEKRNSFPVVNGKNMMPDGAGMNSHGDGWVCKSGYRQAGKHCEYIQIPPNATLNYSGHDWECDKGFRRTGNRCEEVKVPENASLNYSGHSWECNKGFCRRGNACLPCR